jgi:hypothetical protein
METIESNLSYNSATLIFRQILEDIRQQTFPHKTI